MHGSTWKCEMGLICKTRTWDTHNTDRTYNLKLELFWILKRIYNLQLQKSTLDLSMLFFSLFHQYNWQEESPILVFFNNCVSQSLLIFLHIIQKSASKCWPLASMTVWEFLDVALENEVWNISKAAFKL